jgi:hypothetical protein
LEILEKNNFRIFWKFWTFGKPCFQTFPIFFQTFWPKNRFFFDSKTQTVHSFFKIFEIDLQFWLISELFSEDFCKNFASSKIPFFFRKISKLRQPNISETRENKKFRNFRLTQGPNQWLLDHRPSRSPCTDFLNCSALVDPSKLFFLRFPIFTLWFECFVTYRKKSLILKWPSLA